MSRVGGFKKMNWMTKPSTWQQMEAARARRRNNIQQFREQSYAFASSFAAAQSRQIQAIGEVAAYSAQARLQAKVKELQAGLTERYERLSKLA